jgi:hypothetical protein
MKILYQVAVAMASTIAIKFQFIPCEGEAIMMDMSHTAEETGKVWL